LRGIRAYRDSLKVISKDDLKGFPKLQYLNLYNNDLTTLDSDLFSMSPNLQYVNFGNNKIRNIARNIFKPLKNLKTVYFHDGKMCINQHATKVEEIPDLISNLSVFCPPTYEMMMKDIWSDEEFLRRINEVVERKLEGLEKKIRDLEKEFLNK
jgi:Leucine-rich repeat (LRR) protein